MNGRGEEPVRDCEDRRRFSGTAEDGLARAIAWRGGMSGCWDKDAYNS